MSLFTGLHCDVRTDSVLYCTSKLTIAGENSLFNMRELAATDHRWTTVEGNGKLYDRCPLHGDDPIEVRAES